MTMRAYLTRNSASGVDGFNQPVAPTFTALATVACFAWSDTMRELVDSNKTAVVYQLQCMVPKGTDVTRLDRVQKIADRQVITLFDGEFLIDGDPEIRADHLLLTLRKVS
jgi:hypothetical protein